jgi:hypothetical protein
VDDVEHHFGQLAVAVLHADVVLQSQTQTHVLAAVHQYGTGEDISEFVSKREKPI